MHPTGHDNDLSFVQRKEAMNNAGENFSKIGKIIVTPGYGNAVTS